jgi:hypothetical protein
MRGWQIWAILFVVASSGALLGCRNRYDPVRDPHRIARFERNLIPIAARDSGCSPLQVQPVRIGETVWTANTCTGPREYLLACRSRGRRWASCRWERMPTLDEAAAQVLGCPPHAITQHPGFAPTTRVADGCGYRAQMSVRCNGVACGWMADGPPMGGGAPPPGYGAAPAHAAPAPAASGSQMIVIVPGPR